MATSSAPPIPSLPSLPFFGNVLSLGRDGLVQSLVRLSGQLGPIDRLDVPGDSILLIGSHRLVDDACDTQRFVKALHRPLQMLRDISLDGLFTAYNHEENWGKAHRVLMPAFGPQAMRGYFADMLDIATQMFVKWEWLGPDASIDITDNMTRLTLDTIALCGMGYRFNSFYRTDVHPFVDAMAGALVEAQMRGGRLPVQNRLAFAAQRKFDADKAFMFGITEELIARYRTQPPPQAAKHLLALMLGQPDPVTGTTLDIANIQRQLVTFLIAGHETTSACIGRVFTLQEATLVLAMMTHRFDFQHVAPYTLELKETLTIKPVGLNVRMRPRVPHVPATRPRGVVKPANARPRALNAAPASRPSGTRHDTAVALPYGSNAGTSESLARRIAGDAEPRGYRAEVSSLDAAAAAPGEAPLIIVTSSYNGQPADNARAFVAWADLLPPGALSGRAVAVFGCGDRNWASTYQAIPRRLCDRLVAAGSTLLLPHGEGDASVDFFGDCDRAVGQRALSRRRVDVLASPRGWQRDRGHGAPAQRALSPARG